MSAEPCTCGDRGAHIVARRETADGHAVALWNDGAFTWGVLGRIINGCALRPTATDVAAGVLVAGEICLWDADDIPRLIRTARRLARNEAVLPGDLRAAMAPRGVQAMWIVLSAHADGTPEVSVWRLPRLLASGLAVWRERGRYRIMREIQRSGTYEAAGGWLPTMRAVRAELAALGVRGFGRGLPGGTN